MRLNRHNHLWVLGTAVFVIGLMAPGSFADDSSPNATSSGFEYPGGSPAKIARAFVTAFNSGDETALADFCTTHESEAALEARSLKSQIYQYGGLCRMLGTISPYSVTKRNNSKIVLLVRSEKLGTWFNVGVEMDKDLPGKAAHVYVRPASAPEMIGRS
jgi:hypothetical protein